MKISGTGPVTTTPAKRRDQASRSGGAFAGQLKGNSPVQEVAPPADVTSVSTLLSAQEVGDPLEERRRAIQRGEDLLDRLDELQHGLLIGAYPAEKLGNLLVMVQQQQNRITDPRLREILGDIEVRAAVELAKLGK